MLDGMTNIKASEVLKELKDYTEDLPHYSPDEVAEALEMAIKALEAQPNRCDSCIHSEEQDGSNCYECVKGMADNFEAQPTDAVKCDCTTEEIAKSFIEDVEAVKDQLEAQPSEDTEVIKVSKGAVKARIGRYVIYDVDWLKENFYSTEEKIYGQPKQPCEDCISRAKALDTLKTSFLGMSFERYKKAKKLFEHLPSVTPKGVTVTDFADKCKECGKIQNELAEDCISRQALRQKLQEHHDFFVNAFGGFENMNYIDKARVDKINDCIAMVVNEPSVIPQFTDEEVDRAQAVEQAYVDKMVELAVEESKRPKGKWIVISCEPTDIFKCSECGMRVVNQYNYCPMCGAEMSGGGEDDEDSACD